MRLPACTFSALLLAASFAVAAPAFGKEPSRAEAQLAKDMVKEAQGEAKAGRCADAVEIVKQALAIQESTEARMVMGDCQVELHALKGALASYERAVEIADERKDKARIDLLARKCDDVKGRIPTLSIALPKTVDGAAVKLDGEPVSANDLEGAIRVDPGKHLVEVEAPGRKPFSRTLEVAEKEQVSVDVVLVEQSAQKTEEKPKSKGPPLVTWIAAGVGVALVGGGVGAYLVAGSKASAGADACRTAVACDDAQRSGVRALDGAALGLWIGGGLSLGAAAALWALAPKAAPKTEARLVVGPGSIHVVGAF